MTKRKISFSRLACAGILAAGLCMLQACLPPKPTEKPERVSSKVIVTSLGEVTQNAQYVGEGVHYKIYYVNTSKRTMDIRIADILDKNLNNVRLRGGVGQYNADGHYIVWEFKDVAAAGRGSVEFTAVIGAAERIANRAVVQIAIPGKLSVFDPKQPAGKIDSVADVDAWLRLPRQDRATLETNLVETRVYQPPRLGWIPFEKDAKPGATLRTYMKDSTTSDVMVNFEMPGMFARAVKAQNRTFHRFAMPGQASSVNLGRPELPMVGQVVEVPYGVSFTLEVVKTKQVKLDAYRVYPAQAERVDVRAGDPRTTFPAAAFAQDAALYLKDALFPEALASVQAEDIGVIRGRRLIFLKVHPVQYNPVTFETIGFSQIEVKVKYSNPAQIQAPARRLQNPAFEKYLKALVMNYRSPERSDDGGAGGNDQERQGCDYLILTTTDFYNVNDPNNAVLRLSQWKERKGLRTRIVDVGKITGGNNAASLKTYLKNAYTTWSRVPAYILIIGDAEFIPPDYQTGHPSHNNTLVGTDLYYSTLDGDDYFPDVFLGRLPVDSQAEAGEAIDRIINYESNPPNAANFYTRALLSALFEDESGFPDDGTEDGTEDRPWIECVEEIREYLLNNGYTADRVYTSSSGWPGDPASSQPANYEDGTVLPADLRPANGFQWNGTDADVRNAINAGRFLVTYRDHGGREDWSATGFNNADADALTNGALSPLVFSIACQTGWFDNETDDAALNTNANDECLCEHFLLGANRGVLAVIGATRNSWTGRNDFMMFGLHRALWPAFVPNPPITGYPGWPDVDPTPLSSVGQIMNFGKAYMARSYGPATNRKITFEMYHCFGDPETPVLIQRPIQLTVVHPEAIGSTGEQDFVVMVKNAADNKPVNMARVVLTRDNQTMQTLETNAGGIARFTLTAPASGDWVITVTALNCRPYEGKIAVTAGGGEINRLDPDNGVENQMVHVGGKNYSGSEIVEVRFSGSLVNTPTAAAGSFGQAGGMAIDMKIPSPADLGPKNVTAKGMTSNRAGVDVFQVRTANPIDLYLYDQWDSSTWGLHPGDNPTWNNPSIQLYDAANNPVESNNLVAATTYTIRAEIRNDTDFLAKGVKVTFKWADFGLGQPGNAWNPIGVAEIDVPAHTPTKAEVSWTTPGTGHLCVLAETYHVEDINANNNLGQENCHVGPTSSPAKVSFMVYNPAKTPKMVFLELRQLRRQGAEGPEPLWDGWIQHPDPQLLAPGERREATVIIDPDRARVKSGQIAEFSLTGFIDNKIIGGVNFTIRKK